MLCAWHEHLADSLLDIPERVVLSQHQGDVLIQAHAFALGRQGQPLVDRSRQADDEFARVLALIGRKWNLNLVLRVSGVSGTLPLIPIVRV